MHPEMQGTLYVSENGYPWQLHPNHQTPIRHDFRNPSRHHKSPIQLRDFTLTRYETFLTNASTLPFKISCSAIAIFLKYVYNAPVCRIV